MLGPLHSMSEPDRGTKYIKNRNLHNQRNDGSCDPLPGEPFTNRDLLFAAKAIKHFRGQSQFAPLLSSTLKIHRPVRQTIQKSQVHLNWLLALSVTLGATSSCTNMCEPIVVQPYCWSPATYATAKCQHAPLQFLLRNRRRNLAQLVKTTS